MLRYRPRTFGLELLMIARRRCCSSIPSTCWSSSQRFEDDSAARN